MSKKIEKKECPNNQSCYHCRAKAMCTPKKARTYACDHLTAEDRQDVVKQKNLWPAWMVKKYGW